jgi:hypothetical protein
MHLPGQRASRCPQEDGLFRPSVAAIFVSVAWNPLFEFHSGLVSIYPIEIVSQITLLRRLPAIFAV